MGVRAVNRKFEMIELVAVMVVTMNMQQLGATWDVSRRAFSSHTENWEKRLFRSVDEIYR